MSQMMTCTRVCKQNLNSGNHSDCFYSYISLYLYSVYNHLPFCYLYKYLMCTLGNKVFVDSTVQYCVLFDLTDMLKKTRVSTSVKCDKWKIQMKRKLKPLELKPSLGPSRPRRSRMWRHLLSLSGKFALGSKPPPVTRIAPTGLGTRLS